MEQGHETHNDPPTPKWKPLNRYQRRVIGVLVEKAKTTPNSYPLSLNAVVTGSNQKSNRDPQIDLTPDAAEDSLETLREAGAVGEVHGDGRVIKYRHYMKDWLAVDGTELAVMAELLLRGAQTIGDLRGRAARMSGSTLPDVAALRPVVQSLITKGLVVALTEAGRGQVITHTLYSESEMQKLRTQYAGGAPQAVAPSAITSPTSSGGSAPAVTEPTPSRAAATEATAIPGRPQATDVAELRLEVDQLRTELARLSKEVEDIWSNIR